MNESCLIWLSYVSYDWVLSVMNESFSFSICSVWVCVFVGHVDMLSHAGILLKVQWQVAVWRPFNTLQRTANPWHHTTPTTPTRTSGASNEAKDRVPALNSIGCLLDSILHHKSIWLRNKLFLAPAPWGQTLAMGLLFQHAFHGALSNSSTRVTWAQSWKFVMLSHLHTVIRLFKR